ncbi:Protein of unknown function [Gryllus bimaculatus]|nr:Protein of unknown function [Gryllus bimaculatus]
MNLLIDSLPYPKGSMTALQRLAEVCSRELKKIEYEEYAAAKVKQWEERALARAAANEVNRNETVSHMMSASFCQPAGNPPGQTPLIGDQKGHQATIIDENGNEKVSHVTYTVYSQPVQSASGQMPLLTRAAGPAPGPTVQPPPAASPFKTPPPGPAPAKRARLAKAAPGPRQAPWEGAARAEARGRSKRSTNVPVAPKAPHAYTHQVGGFINANVCAHYAAGQVDARARAHAPAHAPASASARMFCFAPGGAVEPVGARPWHVVVEREGSTWRHEGGAGAGAGAGGHDCALCGRAFELAPHLVLHLRAQHGVEAALVQAGAAVAVMAPLYLPAPTPALAPPSAHPTHAC